MLTGLKLVMQMYSIIFFDIAVKESVYEYQFGECIPDVTPLLTNTLPVGPASTRCCHGDNDDYKMILCQMTLHNWISISQRSLSSSIYGKVRLCVGVTVREMFDGSLILYLHVTNSNLVIIPFHHNR